jgi:hypothetical protein
MVDTIEFELNFGQLIVEYDLDHCSVVLAQGYCNALDIFLDCTEHVRDLYAKDEDFADKINSLAVEIREARKLPDYSDYDFSEINEGK